MAVFIVLSLPHFALGIFAAGKHFNHRDKYGTEEAIKLAKKVK